MAAVASVVLLYDISRKLCAHVHKDLPPCRVASDRLRSARFSAQKRITNSARPGEPHEKPCSEASAAVSRKPYSQRGPYRGRPSQRSRTFPSNPLTSITILLAALVNVRST